MNDKTDSYNVTAEADQAHDDKWLADQVVALKVRVNGVFVYEYNGGYIVSHLSYRAANTVRDPRVAMVLMEKVWGVNTVRKGDEWESHVVPVGQIREFTARNENLVRAIVEACVKALL